MEQAYERIVEQPTLFTDPVEQETPYQLTTAQRIYLPFKRLFDIVFSLLALIVLSPLFLVVAIIIKRDSPGPVFFKQTRAGKNGEPFSVYKFRTMYEDAEEKLMHMEAYTSHPTPIDIKQRLIDDPRITKVGVSLRRTSIDEFPQFANVFLGDMSLVGPRPLPLREQDALNEHQHQRELVKPGLTCYWQVSGRSLLSEQKRAELDLQYINEMSLLTDIALVFRTIPAVLSGEGAY